MIPFDHVPAPESYYAILGILDGFGVISIKKTIVNDKIVEEKIEPLKPFNLETFTESELDVLRKVSFKLVTQLSGFISVTVISNSYTGFIANKLAFLEATGIHFCSVISCIYLK